LQHSDGAQVAFYLCANNAADATISVGSETINAKATDNYSKAVKVSGTSTVVTFNANTYLHAIKVTNNIDARIKDENGYLQVAAGDGDALLAAIEQANNAGNVKIYLPNGTYDFGETVLTSITADNISIIGESMDGTIIRNEPESIKEGINLTATIHNKAANLYMQDLTLQNALDYYGSKSGAGRAVCLTDQGENTICKNVKMLSYQDTYYSHKASKYYWEDSEIHGTVDYICGDGDVVYNRVLFVNENRNASSTPNGETTTAAPYTSASCTWGYVMLDCTIDVKSKTFNLGRSWGGNSSLRYIRTTLNQPETLLSSRFTIGGMNVAAYAFYEYGTKNAAGNVICPASNVVTFTHASGNRSYETIIGAEGFTGTPATAEGYTIDAIFGDWHPDQIAAQAIPSTSDTEGVYLVNGSIVTELPTGTNMVRKANGRGGFGPETQIDITAVEMVEASEKAKAAEGAFVVDGKVVIVKNGKQFTAAGARIK
jgi:pectin methylesterase-like acyl-CoA thioesterase